MAVGDLKQIQTMKKIIILTAAALTVFAACSKEKDVVSGEKVPAGMVKASFYADIDQTKSTESGAVFSWTENEEVAVVAADDANPLKFTCDNVAEGHFTGTIGEGKSFGFAISPYNAAGEMMEDGGDVLYEINFATEYSNYVPGTTNAIMVGTPSTSGKFMFRHAAAAFKFTVENVPVGTATVSVTTDANITGTVSKVVLSGSGLEISNSDSGLNGKEVDLTLKDAVTAPNQTLTFYVPVPTGNYTSLTVTFFDGSLNELVSKEKTGLNINLSRGDVYYTPKMKLAPVTLAGNYIIVSKAASKDTWVVMKSGIDGNGRWSYDATEIGYDTDVDLTNSSIDFSEYSNSAHKFIVEASGNGYVLKDYATNKYIVHYGGSNNKGKEVDEADKVAFDVTTKNADGTWTFGSFVGDTPDTYSLQYNVGNYFSFYKSTQAPIYLIPYVGNPEKVTLSISCEDNLVTISAHPSEAEIYYTLDGTTPTSSSTHYTAPFSITKNEEINAIAFAPSSDYIDSDVVTENVTWVDLNAHVYYVKVKENLSDWSGDYLFVYEGEKVAFNGGLTDLDVVNNGSSVTIENDKIEKTSATAAISFSISSVDGGYSIQSASGKFIGNSGNSNGLSTADTYSSNYLNTISYANNTLTITSAGGKTLSYNSTSGQKRFRYLSSTLIQAYKLQDNRDQVATPSFSVPAGEVSVGTPVELACTTAGATIHYTIDGSKPSSSSPTYSTAIVVNEGMTIKAIAIKEGMKDSDIATVVYTVPICAVPVIDPASGQVVSGTTVTITCATSGSTIRYTLDNSEPTATSTEYSTPIVITTAVTIKAKAFKNGFVSSATAEATYTIKPSTVGEGTLASPYTVSDILAVYTDAGSGDNTVYVTGEISEITEVSTEHGNATYKITDGTNEIIVYRGKYLDNVSFTDEDQIAVKDIVVILGKINIYNNEPQLAQGNYLVSLTSDPNAPSLSVSPETTSANPASWPADNNEAKTFTVTPTNGSWTFDDSDISGWATVSRTDNVLTVTPIAKQATEAHSGSIVIRLTPSQSGYSELTETIYLSQAKYNSGGDVVPPANTVLFSETFDSAADGSSASVYYSSTGATGAYNSGTYGSLTYTRSNSNNVQVENAASAGGTAKQIMINKNGGSLTISGIKSYGATSVRVTFKYICAKSTAPITATCGSTNSGNFSSTSSAVASFDATVSGDTFDLVIRKTSTANSTAARFDDITITVLN